MISAAYASNLDVGSGRVSTHQRGVVALVEFVANVSTFTFSIVRSRRASKCRSWSRTRASTAATTETDAVDSEGDSDVAAWSLGPPFTPLPPFTRTDPSSGSFRSSSERFLPGGDADGERGSSPSRTRVVAFASPSWTKSPGARPATIGLRPPGLDAGEGAVTLFGVAKRSSLGETTREEFFAAPLRSANVVDFASVVDFAFDVASVFAFSSDAVTGRDDARSSRRRRRALFSEVDP